MQCSLFQSLLNNAVESHADSVSEEVRSHGSTCTHAGCREAWDDFSLLTTAISQWQASLPQADLVDHVMRELCPPPADVGESPVPGQTSITLKKYFEQSWQDFQAPQQRPWAAAVLVAAVMLMIGTMIVSLPPAPDAQIAVRQRSNPKVGDTAPQLASHPTGNVAVATVEWAQMASSVMANTIVSIPERSRELVPGDTWEIDWKQKLEPLRRDAHAAWDKLLELPMKKDEG
jgi:hypothetical protein